MWGLETSQEGTLLLAHPLPDSRSLQQRGPQDTDRDGGQASAAVGLRIGSGCTALPQLCMLRCALAAARRPVLHKPAARTPQLAPPESVGTACSKGPMITCDDRQVPLATKSGAATAVHAQD